MHDEAKDVAYNKLMYRDARPPFSLVNCLCRALKSRGSRSSFSSAFGSLLGVSRTQWFEEEFLRNNAVFMIVTGSNLDQILLSDSLKPNIPKSPTPSSNHVWWFSGLDRWKGSVKFASGNRHGNTLFLQIPLQIFVSTDSWHRSKSRWVQDLVLDVLF